MGEFFNGWRRKSGVMTLVLACVFMGGWVRSLSVIDFVQFASGPSTREDCTSFHHSMIWGRIHEDTSKLAPSWRSVASATLDASTLDAFLEKSRLQCSWKRLGFGSGEFQVKTANGDRQGFWIIPYWPFAIPLTLASAYLLLSKPRKSTPAKITEPIANEGT